MKNIPIMLILNVFFIQKIFCQETITKDRPLHYEEYEVLTSNKKIKHGRYFRLNKLTLGGYAFESIGNYSNGLKSGYWEFYYDLDNNIKEKGFYKNDKRDSLWTFFYPQYEVRNLAEVQTNQGISLQIQNANPVVSMIGEYKNGNKVGTWEYFDPTGDISQRYSYDKDLLIYSKNVDLNSVGAGYIGGEYFLNQQLYEVIDFMSMMQKVNTKINLQSGRVSFTFVVDEKGKISNILEMENTLKNKKIYSRILAAIESIKKGWYPKMEDGVAQSEQKKVTFMLNVEKNYDFEVSAKSYWSKIIKGFYLQILSE